MQRKEGRQLRVRGEDKNGKREGSTGVNPANVWSGIIYGNVITSLTG